MSQKFKPKINQSEAHRRISTKIMEPKKKRSIA